MRHVFNLKIKYDPNTLITRNKNTHFSESRNQLVIAQVKVKITGNPEKEINKNSHSYVNALKIKQKKKSYV